jgi:hypothetical protein
LRLLVFLAACGFQSMVSGASKCPRHHQDGYYYCDGFEDGLDTGYVENGAYLDGTRFARGAQSLALPPTALLSDSLLQFDPNESHLRLFFYTEDGNDGSLAALGDLQLELVNGTLMLGLAGSSSNAVNRWVCVELVLATSGGPWQGSVIIDGKETLSMASALGNGADHFTLQSEGSSVWFDELVLDHRPIGCDS